jgi:hypothetical protein
MEDHNKFLLFKSNSQKIKRMTIIKTGIFILISALMFHLFQSNKTMHPVWLVPYLSGAKNYSLGEPWHYSKNELNDIKKNGSYEYFENYKFKKYNNEDLVVNHYNSKNYLYIVIAVSKMFWWLPIIKALKLFQFLIHLILSSLLLYNLSNYKRYIFLFIYVWNPFVIYFATFPFYYFYQFIPSVIAILVLKLNTKPWFFNLMMMVLGFLINVRITIIFLVITTIFYFYKKHTFKELLIGLMIFIITFLGTIDSESGKNPWHTMYIGIGAYPNNYLSELSDFVGTRLYKDVTGESISFNNKENYEKYNNIMKEYYIKILKEDPILLMKNAVFNYLQAFAFGHFANRGLIINIVSILCGLLVLIYMILKKKYNYVILISASGIGHCLYYPPIQQYMFGSFVIIIFGLIDSINTQVLNRIATNLRLNKLKFLLLKD